MDQTSQPSNPALMTMTRLLAATTVVLFVAAYYPVLQLLAQKWSASEEYTHAFLVVPIALYMVWQLRDRITYGSGLYPALAGFALLLSGALYIFALLTQVHTLIILSMYLTLISLIVFFFGLSTLWALITPVILLLLLIPVPEQLYIKLTFPLQLKVSEASDLLVRAVGIPLFREGNVMHIPGKSFEVVEACSGLRSIMSLTALSVIMGFFMLKRPLSKVVLFAAAIPVAIVVNIMRVTVMILAFSFFGWDLTDGALHSWIGLAIFVVSFVLLLLIERVLEWRENR